MVAPDRPRLRVLFALYAAFALGWVALAHWVVPPLLVGDRPGRLIAAVRRYIQNAPAPFLTQDILGCWREFAGAVLIAAVLHLTIIVILRRYDFRSGAGQEWENARAGRRGSLALAIVSLAFLAVTVLSGPRQDYFFYLQIWSGIRRGHDPWFNVAGLDGEGPLNAYGPLFNPLAGLAWVNPLAPKLIFAYAYIVFAVSQIKGFPGSDPCSRLRALGLTALFWNPFPWVEIALFGHFDILVGLFCLAAVRARVQARDILSGICLALGVLLKYLPIVLLPFLALDGRRLRRRFIIAATTTIVFGLAVAWGLWGPSVLRPVRFAAVRRSTTLSIFRFIRGAYSPLQWFRAMGNYDDLAPVVLFLALLRAWSWARVRRPNIEALAVIVVTTTVLLYRVGYPQYQIVPLVLASSWAIGHWEHLRARTFLAAAMGCYFGWLAAFDLYYSLVKDLVTDAGWSILMELAGLPTFLFGCMFLASVVRSSAPEDGEASGKKIRYKP
jgi:hypothetical protein